MGTAAIGWLGLGVVLHLANQVARGQGWHAVIRAACPDTPVRRRDAVGAWVAGAGASGVLSARGGDGVRLLLLRPRTGEHGYPVLTGTLVAEGAGEAAIGFALLGAAFAAGISPGVGLPAPALLAVDPAFANQGHGRGLVATALEAARDAGIALVVLVGDEPYYARLGFKPVPHGQIALPGPVDPDRLLAVELAPDALATFGGLMTADRAT